MKYVFVTNVGFFQTARNKTKFIKAFKLRTLSKTKPTKRKYK